MGAIASQITSLTIVYSTVYSDADQRKHQSSASLAFVRGIHQEPVNSPHKWPVTRKCFHMMTSSCKHRGVIRKKTGAVKLFIAAVRIYNVNEYVTHSAHWMIFDNADTSHKLNGKTNNIPSHYILRLDLHKHGGKYPRRQCAAAMWEWVNGEQLKYQHGYEITSIIKCGMKLLIHSQKFQRLHRWRLRMYK